jgi:hypothetical protein
MPGCRAEYVNQSCGAKRCGGKARRKVRCRLRGLGDAFNMCAEVAPDWQRTWHQTFRFRLPAHVAAKPLAQGFNPALPAKPRAARHVLAPE